MLSYIKLAFLVTEIGLHVNAGPAGPVAPPGPATSKASTKHIAPPAPTPPGPEPKGCPECEKNYYCIWDAYFPHCVPNFCPWPMPPMDCAMLPCYRCDDVCVMVNNYPCKGGNCPRHPECMPKTCKQCACKKNFKCVYERVPCKPPCPCCPKMSCVPWSTPVCVEPADTTFIGEA